MWSPLVPNPKFIHFNFNLSSTSTQCQSNINIIKLQRNQLGKIIQWKLKVELLNALVFPSSLEISWWCTTHITTSPEAKMRSKSSNWSESKKTSVLLCLATTNLSTKVYIEVVAATKSILILIIIIIIIIILIIIKSYWFTISSFDVPM